MDHGSSGLSTTRPDGNARSHPAPKESVEGKDGEEKKDPDAPEEKSETQQ